MLIYDYPHSSIALRELPEVALVGLPIAPREAAADQEGECHTAQPLHLLHRPEALLEPLLPNARVLLLVMSIARVALREHRDHTSMRSAVVALLPPLPT
jgi:hypothetical protein